MQARQVPGIEVLVAPDAGSVDDEGGVAVDLGIGRRVEKERNLKNEKMHRDVQMSARLKAGMHRYHRMSSVRVLGISALTNS